MIIITLSTIAMIMLLAVIIFSIFFVGWTVKLIFIDKDMNLFLIPHLFLTLLVIVLWIAVLSAPCTGYQMIQLGNTGIPPEICEQILSK